MSFCRPVFCILIFLSVNCVDLGTAERSKLVQIACSRNPSLSFCDRPVKTVQNETTAASEEPSSTEDDGVEPLPDLPTFEEALLKSAENASETKRPPAKKTNAKNDDERNEDSKEVKPTSVEDVTAVSDVTEETTDEAPELPKLLDSSTEAKPTPKKQKHDRDELQESGEREDIPDDPILEEPLPSGDENMGSLLRLPKPASPSSRSRNKDKQPAFGPGLVTPPPLPRTVAPGVPEPTRKPEDFVEVFITQFCVDNRKNFLTKCRVSAVNPENLEFCKSYPSKCQSDEPGVIPLLAYCEQFIHNYVRVCGPNVKRNKKGKQFCKAYDQFCVPQPTPQDLMDASQDLIKCEEIVGEAKKVCNPFPQPSDRLNHLRCTQFFKFCGNFVDWV